MITIESSSTVVPDQPTPNGLLPLSEADQTMQWTHAPLIVIYKPKNNDRNNTIPFAIETMKSSLSRALVHYYPLAGRLHWIEGGRLELYCNALGAQLLEAYSDAELDELGDCAPTGRIRDLIPKVDYTSPIEEWPLLLVQLTRFRGGGLCVAIASSHIIADGLAAANFINSWAKLARGDDLGSDEMPFHDRTILRSREPLMPPRFDHLEFTKPPLLIGCSDSEAEQKKEISIAMLKVTKEQVEGLQRKANESLNQSMVMMRPYTRYEAIAGHIWRCACKARGGDKCQPTRFRIGADVRNRLKPPIPKGYFGNAMFSTETSTCFYGDLLSKPLSYAAGKLRETIERLTDDYIRSALDTITSQKDVTWLRRNLHVRGVPQPFFGNPNVTIVSWINLPLYGADFGWGKPKYIGPGFLNSDGRAFILPSPGDGSLTIVQGFQTQYMDSFKKIFYEDMMEQSSATL